MDNYERLDEREMDNYDDFDVLGERLREEVQYSNRRRDRYKNLLHRRERMPSYRRRLRNRGLRVRGRTRDDDVRRVVLRNAVSSLLQIIPLSEIIRMQIKGFSVSRVHIAMTKKAKLECFKPSENLLVRDGITNDRSSMSPMIVLP